MKYLVMECHPAYAVLLDEKGRFIKAANLSYSVGETVTDIIPMKEPKTRSRGFEIGVKLRGAVAAAACLCIISVLGWNFLIAPAGTVRIQINPDVLITLNKAGFATDAVGLNDDGDALLSGYDYRFKNIEKITSEIIEKAKISNMAKSGDGVFVTAKSDSRDWEARTLEKIKAVVAEGDLVYSEEPPVEEIIPPVSEEIVVPDEESSGVGNTEPEEEKNNSQVSSGGVIINRGDDDDDNDDDDDDADDDDDDDDDYDD